MNQTWLHNLQQSKEKFTDYWKGLNSKNKVVIIGTFLFVIIALSIFTYFSSRPQYVPLYSNELSQREIGDIKAALDARGFKNYQLSDTGTTILVPKKDAPELLVHLASEGLPENGKISYEVFSQNMTFGATDRQLDVIERDAMQNELAELIKRISGIKSAEVMITLPEESVFIRPEETDQSTASIVVETEPGQHLSQPQIKALYYLVSRSVPNLPIENIVIMDQYSELLELREPNDDELHLEAYEQQRKIKQNVEQDIQKDLQRMLGTIMGQDKVFVHTFVTLNFDKVKTQENLVQPVDKENNQGIAISAEKLSKAFKGDGGAAGGIVGTGETDVPRYPGAVTGGESEYEELQDRVNYEVNRISSEITKSPYKIEDITINVGVEPPDPNKPETLTAEAQGNIKTILENVVRTALGNKEGLTEEDVAKRIAVFPRVFAGKESVAAPSEDNPLVLYGIIAVAVLAVAGLGFVWLRRRKANKLQEEALYEEEMLAPIDLTEKVDEAENSVQKQLDNMAKQNPEEFVQLLRTWMSDERE